MRFEGEQRLVVQVLVVHHVVLQSPDDAAERVDFEDEYTVRIEQLDDTGGDIVDLGNVRINVVRGNEVGTAVSEFLRKKTIEVFQPRHPIRVIPHLVDTSR